MSPIAISTRTSNSSCHPGAIDASHKHRQKAEIKDECVVSATQTAKAEAKLVSTLKHIKKLEAELQASKTPEQPPVPASLMPVTGRNIKGLNNIKAAKPRIKKVDCVTVEEF